VRVGDTGPARGRGAKTPRTVHRNPPPKTQVDPMPAAKFFAYAAEVMKLQPPHLTDEPIIAQMRRIGIDRAKPFDFDSLDPAVKKALQRAPEDAQGLKQWKGPNAATGR